VKSIFIAGSRKFHKDIQNLIRILSVNGIKAAVAEGKNLTKEKNDTLGEEKEALLDAFSKIDNFDVCYVYSKEGYIGKTVAMEIAYAYSRKKDIFALSNIEELSAQALISKVMSPDKLINYCK
jgi:hypothetical protein